MPQVRNDLSRAFLNRFNDEIVIHLVAVSICLALIQLSTTKLMKQDKGAHYSFKVQLRSH